MVHAGAPIPDIQELAPGPRGAGTVGEAEGVSPGRGIDCVMRLHQARKNTFREGRRLGKDDRLITWKKPSQRLPAWSQEEWAALPDSLSVRLIRLHVSTPGFRTSQVTLVTTLTDEETYPADKIRALYAERWGVELHFPQIKISLGLDILRCKSPELIEKETIIHLIAYNLIRLFMQRAAADHGVDLGRLSFKGTLDTVRHFAAAIHAARATPRRQDALIDQMLALIAGDLVPHRSERAEPRAKKLWRLFFCRLHDVMLNLNYEAEKMVESCVPPRRGCVGPERRQAGAMRFRADHAHLSPAGGDAMATLIAEELHKVAP